MPKGVVEKKLEIRKEGLKPFDVLTINGVNYSCFKLSLTEGVKEGDQVEFDFRESEEYKNITDLKVLAAAEPVAAVDRQEVIIRQTALKAAVEIHKAAPPSLKEILETANEFVKWIKECKD